MNADAMTASASPAPALQRMVVLHPVSHPQLAPIPIHDRLFAIGRGEPPFDIYPPELSADLSRRHARIFCEHGAIYLADLGSKNGTTVNGVAVRQAIAELHNGDQVGFGSALTYRVQLEEDTDAPRHAARLASLTLTPEHEAAQLQSIVVTELPFLVSKADPTFARYQDACPQQLNYLSRRHAHIFIKGNLPFIEDLGSTNGTFVNGRRLDEMAVALHDGDVIAFGGHHFVYRVLLQWEASDPTVTRLGLAPARGAPSSIDEDKTTFVTAADSFLDIFCVDHAPAQDDAPDAAAAGTAAVDDAAARPRGKAATFTLALLSAFGANGTQQRRRLLRWGAGALVLAVLAAWSLYRIGAPEREAQALAERGAYAQAAIVASAALARDPDNARLKALGTAALLKAHLPAWIGLIKARQFERAAALLAAMKRQARNNPELAPLLEELDWIAKLQAFIAARGGAQAPIRNPADAAAIESMLRQWEDQNEAHQRAFVTMSSYVPAFRDTYADALSAVRKLALTKGQERNEPIIP
ncbi:MAG: FHA domain-containing protein [Pseudomonadota bacterium]